MRKTKNVRYSLRAYARDLTMNPSTLSRIMSGQLNPTLDSIVSIIKKLKLSSIQEVRALARYSSFQAVKPLMDEYQVSSQQANIEQDSWHYSAILEAFNLSSPPQTLLQISQITGIAPALVESKLCLLTELKLLVRMQKGWKRSTRKNTNGSQATASVRKVIKEYLDLAVESMNRDPVEQRLITGTTAAIDPSRLPEANEMIREFRVQLIDFLTGGERKEIYRLNLSLHPIKPR